MHTRAAPQSTLLRAMVQEMQNSHGNERVFVTASTGAAACEFTSIRTVIACPCACVCASASASARAWATVCVCVRCAYVRARTCVCVCGRAASSLVSDYVSWSGDLTFFIIAWFA